MLREGASKKGRCGSACNKGKKRFREWGMGMQCRNARTRLAFVTTKVLRREIKLGGVTGATVQKHDMLEGF